MRISEPFVAAILGTLYLALSGCSPAPSIPVKAPRVANREPTPLAKARREFKTKLSQQEQTREAAPQPPADVFRLVKYPSAVGDLAAYVSPDPKDGGKHPAIIWITGGDCNSIGDCWSPRPEENEQSASVYRKQGIVMMVTSLRGGNDNPGTRESFLGEVDDVIAAADFLAKQSYVDPDRIYLGGHSTGGTLALLVAESTDRFRAVFAFGPVAEIAGYGPKFAPFDTNNAREFELRSPLHWLDSIASPTYVFEGAEQGNAASLETMQRATSNDQIDFFTLRGANHFDILGPTNRLIATKILKDTGPTCNLSFTEDEVTQNLWKP